MFASHQKEKFMAKPFLETKHTLSVLDKIKKDIAGVLFFVQIASMVVFSGYYIYLICINAHSLPHLVSYIVLFGVVATSFVTELMTKAKQDEHRVAKRLWVEKKRQIAMFTRALKYLAKTVTVVLALVASAKAPVSELDTLFDFASIAMLIGSILLEIVGNYVNKCIDRLTLSLKMDYEGSALQDYVLFASKITGNKQAQLSNLEEQLRKASGESVYTEQEQKIRQEIALQAEQLKQQRTEQLKARIVATKSEILQHRKELSKDEQSQIKKQFALCKRQAVATILSNKKLQRLFEDAGALLDVLPLDVEPLHKVPTIVALVGNYANKTYRDVSARALVTIVATLIFLASPTEIVDDIPTLAHADDIFVVGLALKDVQKELDKFETWQKTL